jgi:uncharacterized protein Yka (UPF0111/DUF47 family)
MFNLFRKKPIDRVDGGKIELKEEGEIAEKAVEQNAEELKEKRERFARFMAKMNTLIERIELIERKIDRIETRLGIKDGGQQN